MAQDLKSVDWHRTRSGVVLVTGGTGFVGSALIARLALEKIHTRACVRRQGILLPRGVQLAQVRGLDSDQDWAPALAEVTTVVHTAARVHVMAEHAQDPLAEFRRINVHGTMQLARQAAAAGVGRFIFVSSIKVNGEATLPSKPFTADDPPAPVDAYGISKMEAEQGLLELAAKSGMEVVIIRPPLVYGPGVKANFAALMHAIKRRWPLPLALIRNRRSLVGLDNLVDLIFVTITHPCAANQVFLVSDGRDLSTPELIREMADAMGTRVRLVPVPVPVLQLGARLINRHVMVQRLCGNLQADISKTRNLLNWMPVVSVQEGLRRTMHSSN